MKFKIGSLVYWTSGSGKQKRVFSGKVFNAKPTISPGSIGVKVRGETYYPLKKYVKRVK